jgi:hypothetical protein
VKLRGIHSLEDLWRAYFFRGVVLDSHEGMVGWLEGRYPIEVRNDIPSPEEMLRTQCEGRRIFTLLLRPEEQFVAYGRHRDACDFLLHDFEHAHKFFADPDSHRGQVRFFRVLRATLGSFEPWRNDQQFNRDFDYLKADMNSHPVHLMKYLKAVVLAAEIRRRTRRDPELDGFWLELFGAWGMAGDTLTAALQLNQPAVETYLQQRLVADFFMPPSPRIEHGLET